MKIKSKIKTILIALGMVFAFLSINNYNIIIDEQDDKNNRNVVTRLTASNSVAYEWNCTWGGGSIDSSMKVAVDSSGNIYHSGYTESFGAGGVDMVLVKYDRNGVQQWNCTWGGGSNDYGYGVAVDSSGNIYLAGYTESFGAGNTDMVLVKYDGNGGQQWNHTWGGSNWDHGYGVAVDSSGNIYLVGRTSSFGAGNYDMVLVKYDGNGGQQWNSTWGGDDWDVGYGTVVDSSGNIYLAGDTMWSGAGRHDMVLVKYDGNGVQQWNSTWGGGYNDLGYEAAVDSSGNIYLVGQTESFGEGSYDMVLVKYDGNGGQQWNRTWGGTQYDLCQGTVVDSSGNIYLAGQTESFGEGLSDMVLVKYDGNGGQQWNRTWGGPNSDGGRGVAVDSSNNIYLAGGTASFGAGSSDMVLVKYDNSAPQIQINSPIQNEVFGSAAPDYNITIDEPHLDMTWYTLDEGITNYTFSELTGTINQTEWDKKRDGPVSIMFYANDTIGYIGFAEVTVHKETYLLYVEIIDQSFSTNEFNIIFSVNNENYQGIDCATVQVWWNGVDVSDSVSNLGNGLYFVSLEPITVASGEVPLLLNMIISADGYEDKNFEMYIAINKFLQIEITEHTYSTENFNFTFFVSDEIEQGIDFATIQIWWNGTDVSSGVINLGNGFYFISLDPITVTPGTDPILLNMIISADGYEDKNIETYFAVDPDTLVKKPAEEFPLIIIIIAIISIVGGIGIVGVSIVLLRKKKRISEGT